MEKETKLNDRKSPRAYAKPELRLLGQIRDLTRTASKDFVIMGDISDPPTGS